MIPRKDKSAKDGGGSGRVTTTESGRYFKIDDMMTVTGRLKENLTLHVQRIESSGMTRKQIAELIDLPYSSFRAMLGNSTSRKISRPQHEKLMNIPIVVKL